MDYTKEYPEVAIKYNDQLVFHKIGPDNINTGIINPILILPRVWEHPKSIRERYTMQTLVAAIKKILVVHANEKRASEIMEKFK